MPGGRRKEPVWVERVVVDAIHLDLIRTHGGLIGVRDENALESALARPRHKWAYSARTNLASLAASMGYALARNHPYRDGNKRVAFLAMAVFLGLNGREIEAPEAEVVAVMTGLAAGGMTERSLETWIRNHLAPSA